MTATFSFGRFELLPANRQLLLDGQAVAIGARAFDVLHALIEHRERLVTKEELLDLAWPGLVVEENNLQVQVSSLRKILGPDAIITIPGLGYRFTVPLRAAASQSYLKPAKDLAPIDDKAPSIAVLPFTDLSPEKDQEYFADGLAEELLNVLSKIRGLRVASRTSAFSFKGSKADIPTVAQKLNVTTILEGSVRKAGKRVRITAQLVEVATDSHLWSETYDRELEDIFAVQDDIAHSVVKGLRSMLSGAELQAATRGRGQNAEAHRLYLQGRFWVDRRTQPDVAKGIEYCRQAGALDPGYALAWAGLSKAYSDQAGYGWAPVVEGFRQAREAVERAMSLEPDLAEGHLALGWICMHYDRDWTRADAIFRRALELAPGNAEVLRGAASLAANLGRQDEAIELFRSAVSLDPLNGTAIKHLGAHYLAANRVDEADTAIRMALELNPQGSFTHLWLGLVRLAQGRLDEALAAIEQEVEEPFRHLGRALVQHARGQPEQSAAALQELVEQRSEDFAFQIAEVYGYRGDVDLAFAWLERAYAQHDAGVGEVMWDPLLRNLHRDPRWQAFLRKLGLVD